MNCPRCQENLRQAQRMAVEIDFCPRCRGIWLDGGELEKLIERSQGYDVVPREGYVEPQYSSPPPSDRNDDRVRSDPREYPVQQTRRDDRDYREDRQRRDDREYRDDRHRPDDRGYHNDGHYRPKKKKSFFGELIDLFD